MVYLRCDKRVRAVKGNLRLDGVLHKGQREKEITQVFQANLPGFFFENLESARHKRESWSKVPGILRKKERKDA